MRFAANKSCIRIFFVFLFVFCLFFCSVESGLDNRKKFKFCKLDHLIQKCGVDQTLQFTSTQNGSGIANSHAEIEQYCYNLVDYFPACARQWFRKCSTNLHADLVFRMLIDERGGYIKAFCDREGYIRNEFLKYSNCLIHHVKLSPAYRKEYIRPLQAAGEMIHSREYSKPIPSLVNYLRDTCCAYNRWENCILKHLAQNCGQPSADVFPYLIRYSASNFVEHLCTRLKYDVTNTKVCQEVNYVAPESLKPLGLKSASLLSYAFSYGCPNVGWGIVPERDW